MHARRRTLMHACMYVHNKQLLEASMIKRLEGAYSLSPLQDGNVEVCVSVCVCVCVFYLRARSLSLLSLACARPPPHTVRARTVFDALAQSGCTCLHAGGIDGT